MPRAIPTVQIDAPEVRVTQWRLPPGSATGHHRHQYDYVVLDAGQAYFRKAGVEHDVRNATSREIVFVDVELKQPG